MITIPTPPSSSLGNFGSYKAVTQPKKTFLPYFVIGAATLLLLAGLYFFFYRGANFSLEAPVIAPPPPLSSLEAKVGGLSNLPLQVIDSPFYKSLKVYGSLPVVADSLGRTNPFIPY
ncbi:MAG: hypothetical protein Q7J30_01345 [Candidatus Azambacteria bacterium]|nr:hypothetical protein [Candidatus Azambacteria bacterium]